MFVISVIGIEKKMTLAEIYKWITDIYPYYQSGGIGWKVFEYFRY